MSDEPTSAGDRRFEPAGVVTERRSPDPHLLRVFRTARRHGVTALGPVAVSAANFLATLVAFRALSNVGFGQLSFVIVVVGFCVSLTNGLLGAPLAGIAHVPVEKLRCELNTYFKSSVVFAAVLGGAIVTVALLAKVSVGAALLFGAYGYAMSLRLVARTFSYTTGRVRTVVRSDAIYSIFLVLGVCAIVVAGKAGLFEIALVFALSATSSIISFGTPIFANLLRSAREGTVYAYGRIWQDLTRWSVLGVVTSEMTINAHAYLVTFISGSRAFALIAVGALLTRPFSLVLTALPDREGPALARTIAGGNMERALRSMKEYLLVVTALWFANQLLAGGVLAWFPGVIIKKGYDVHIVVSVVLIWALITAVRGARSSDCLLLLAAREFRSLANASVVSSGVALLFTLVLLLIGGPTLSLLGILAGDVALWLGVRSGVRRWIQGCLATRPGKAAGGDTSLSIAVPQL